MRQKRLKTTELDNTVVMVCWFSLQEHKEKSFEIELLQYSLLYVYVWYMWNFRLFRQHHKILYMNMV